MDSEDTIRVILAVGENRSLAGKLCQELDGRDGIVLAGELAGGEEMPAVAAASADVLVVAGEAGADTARRLAEAVPGVPVVLITDNVIRDLVPAVKAGVAGLLPADVAGSDLIETIRRVHLWSGRSAALV
ncbi:MAG: hypothetical protein V3S10_00550 [Dehalococcoidales bacterium]